MKTLLLLSVLLVVNANVFQDSLERVNEVRSTYNLQPIKWDYKLAKKAAGLAFTCKSPTLTDVTAIYGPTLSGFLAQEGNYDCQTDSCATTGACESFKKLVGDYTHIGCGFSLCEPNERSHVVCLLESEYKARLPRVCPTTKRVVAAESDLSCLLNPDQAVEYGAAELAYLKARRLEGWDLAVQTDNKATNALDKVMASTGLPTDANFCSNWKFVLELQFNQSAIKAFIDDNYICNQCQFFAVWQNLARLYAYRKRTITSNIMTAYSDTGCARTISLSGTGSHFATINWLPSGLQPDGTATTDTFLGPPWHTSFSFWDADRFTITWLEDPTVPGKLFVGQFIQQTEASFPLPNGGGLVTNPPDRSPFFVPFPGAANPGVAPGLYQTIPVDGACDLSCTGNPFPSGGPGGNPNTGGSQCPGFNAFLQ